MARPRALLAVVSLCGIATAPLLSAHHTVAMTHDITHAVALTGRVIAIQWQNPHVVYHLAVPDGNGGVVQSRQ